MSSLWDKKLNVLVIESSVVWQSVLENSLGREPYIKVVGISSCTRDAITLAERSTPDILIVDENLPDMTLQATIDAIEGVVKAKSPERGILVAILSAQGTAAPRTLGMDPRIFTMIPKSPQNQPSELMEYVKQNVIPEIYKIAVEKRYITPRSTIEEHDSLKAATELINMRQAKPRRIRVIAIGVSTGGPTALGRLLPVICENTDLPILIVQHMPRSFSTSLTDNLKPVCSFAVKEARDNLAIDDRTIYIAPGDQHMLARRTPQGMPYIALSSTPPEGGGFRPSVDVLFKSVAAVYGHEAIGIVLTGMGDDGSKGVGALKERGSYVIVQDEKSSVVWGMPKAVIETGNFDVVLPIDEIPFAIANYVRALGKSA